MPMTGIKVPRNHSQPTRQYGFSLRKRQQTAVTRMSAMADNTAADSIDVILIVVIIGRERIGPEHDAQHSASN